MKTKFTTISVSGAQSGVGKTRVIEALLKELKGWSCLKTTVLHHGLCPTGKECGACDKMDSRFSIASDKKTIEAQDKDTWRFKKAGAKKVLWLRARPEGLKPGLKKALSMFSSKGREGLEGLLIEGTSVLKYLKPDLAILVKNKDSILKDSAREALKKIDLVLTMR